MRVLIAGASGKMGREAMKTVAEHPNLELVVGVDTGARVDDEYQQLGTQKVYVRQSLSEALREFDVDVMLDLTAPGQAPDNVAYALEQGLDCVVGTTGTSSEEWNDLYDEIFVDPEKALQADQGCDPAIGSYVSKYKDDAPALLVVPNFAIGAVLMMQFAEKAARHLPHAEIVEEHHDEKADAPSGTALLTAERIAAARSEKPKIPLYNSLDDKPEARRARGATDTGVPIHSVRLPGLVAHQTVKFGGVAQTLTIRHDSLGRESFMPGVALALLSVDKLRGQGAAFGLERVL